MVDPTKSWEFSQEALQYEIKNKIPWFGAMFTAIYIALYGRFASQWSYLANLYNSIKAASLDRNADETLLADWKAGFIEDAEHLHLSNKENFISVIYAWGKEESVKERYIANTPGGKVRFERLMGKIGKRYNEIDEKQKRSK